MTPYYTDDSVTLYHGDCLDVLRELPDASVHAVVTDPPYGLANTSPEQVADTIVRWVNGDRDYLPGGSGFMGKAWDAFVPPVAVWDECLRVLKPGGHVLAFAGSRTHDLMSLAVRLAGFEIRDSIAWLYGSGFPKSLDVSKAIDKRRDWSLVERLSGEIRRARAEAGLSLAEVGQATLDASDGTYGKWYHRGGHMFFETGRSLPSRPEWDHLRHVLPIAPEFVEVYDEAEREVIQERTMTQGGGTSLQIRMGEAREVRADITAPATPDAERWQGWGTALKPAFEPIVVARKPLAGTVAENVLEHGTGALNIDACRVGDDVLAPVVRGVSKLGTFEGADGNVTAERTGRWPTNVALDESQAAELDRQSGVSVSTVRKPSGRDDRGIPNGPGNLVMRRNDTQPRGVADMGGASRFFPVFPNTQETACATTTEPARTTTATGADGATPAPSTPERSARPAVASGETTDFPTFRYEAKAPTSERPRVDGIAHPTVKPLTLIQWLVRLVTPPGGTVLEPFAGSGTTAEACVIEGFKCIAIEREADYLPLIIQRLTKPIQVGLDFGSAS